MRRRDIRKDRVRNCPDHSLINVDVRGNRDGEEESEMEGKESSHNNGRNRESHEERERGGGLGLA